MHSNLDASGDKNISVGVILGSCLAAFLLGAVIAILGGHFYLKRRRPSIPGSPHYITSKQNPYVTVPLKDMSMHGKRASSSGGSNGISNSPHKNTNNCNSGISIGTPKLFAKPLAEYETATIKRNSHSHANGHIRADLDQSKFFWNGSNIFITQQEKTNEVFDTCI